MLKKYPKKPRRPGFPYLFFLIGRQSSCHYVFFLKKPTRHSGYNLNNASNIVGQCSKAKEKRKKKEKKKSLNQHLTG
jgi:hypothetical protein